MRHEHFLPVVIAALTVLVIGCWNPPPLQSKDSKGNPSGHPSYLWMSVFALIFGSIAVGVFNSKTLKSMSK